MVQWFPGHMAKARRLMAENMKMVDVVVEMADARVPLGSRNPLLNELIGDKPRLLVLTKEDLAEDKITALWLQQYTREGQVALSIDAHGGKNSIKKILVEGIKKQAKSVLEKRQRKGIINKRVRTMVVGISNVGKSTMINFLAGRSAAETGDKPGVTKGKQWIKIDNDVELLDMPGILWPKIEDPETGYKLAAIGSVGDKAYDTEELALWVLEWLRSHKPGRLTTRYKVEEDGENLDLLTKICIKRGFLRSRGEADWQKGAVMLLDEFRAGKLGPITLDGEPPL